jgi:hypothetical protein
MKKITIVTLTLLMLTSCMQEKDVKFKSTDPYMKEKTYVLDTLNNGHILMYERYNRDACCIEYPECPKCKENLRTLIKEVLDSTLKENNINKTIETQEENNISIW